MARPLQTTCALAGHIFAAPFGASHQTAAGMKIQGKPYRTIWPTIDGVAVEVIDQTKLPHRVETQRISTMAQAADAIGAMIVLGVPLIGATAAYGLAVALRDDPPAEGRRDAHGG